MNAAADKEVAPRSPRVLLIGAVGAVLLWLAQPPAGLWPLAWVAPACWLGLAASPAPFGRREYLRLWLAGSFYWLLTVHWVRLPHPLTPLGWAPLAMYLGLYPLMTVAAVRAARRSWGVPLWLAAPVAWTGLELLQARLFTGFLMGAVSHSQAGQPWVRSIAAYVGAYGVTFGVVLVAATVASLVLDWRTVSRRMPRLGGLACALGGVVVVGLAAQLSLDLAPSDGPRPLVALIQGDVKAVWDADPGRGGRIMDRHTELTAYAAERARRDGRRLDLVVWPESMFRARIYTFDGEPTPPLDADDPRQPILDNTASWLRLVTGKADGAAFMAGIDRFDWRQESQDATPTADIYNGVALVGADGEVLQVYDKTHLVPFGEYIPFAADVPALYYLTPISGGLGVGTGPVSMDVPLRSGGVLRVCPTICYESVVPHVVRGHVAELTDEGARPDALVNVTNDAWFWGSSELDMHLACGVYRAVETGLPLMVAGNGGLSAVVDATGEVVAIAPRMTEHVVVADVPPRTAEPTPYARHGDWFAAVCLAACGLVALGELLRWGRFSGAKPTETAPATGDPK